MFLSHNAMCGGKPKIHVDTSTLILFMWQKTAPDFAKQMLNFVVILRNTIIQQCIKISSNMSVLRYAMTICNALRKVHTFSSFSMLKLMKVPLVFDQEVYLYEIYTWHSLFPQVTDRLIRRFLFSAHIYDCPFEGHTQIDNITVHFISRVITKRK